MKYRQETPATDRFHRTHVFLNSELFVYWNEDSIRRGISFSQTVREQLELARKYRKAIEAAEHAPVTFVKDMRKVNGL